MADDKTARIEGLSFESVWAKQEEQGFQYGEEALQQVRFGWELALAQLSQVELTAELKADWAVLKSRLDAYMATCHKQGSKLTRMERILLEHSIEGKSGTRLSELGIGHVTFPKGSALDALADVLREKGSHR